MVKRRWRRRGSLREANMENQNFTYTLVELSVGFVIAKRNIHNELWSCGNVIGMLSPRAAAAIAYDHRCTKIYTFISEAIAVLERETGGQVSVSLDPMPFSNISTDIVEPRIVGIWQQRRLLKSPFTRAALYQRYPELCQASKTLVLE